MRGCNNSKIHISSNFILSIYLLIMFITVQHVATLNRSAPNYTSLHLSTLHFLSFTLHYSPVWFNPSTFPIVLFHPPSLNQTQLNLITGCLYVSSFGPHVSVNFMTIVRFIRVNIYMTCVPRKTFLHVIYILALMDLRMVIKLTETCSPNELTQTSCNQV